MVVKDDVGDHREAYPDAEHRLEHDSVADLSEVRGEQLQLEERDRAVSQRGCKAEPAGTRWEIPDVLATMLVVQVKASVGQFGAMLAGSGEETLDRPGPHLVVVVGGADPVASREPVAFVAGHRVGYAPPLLDALAPRGEPLAEVVEAHTLVADRGDRALGQRADVIADHDHLEALVTLSQNRRQRHLPQSVRPADGRNHDRHQRLRLGEWDLVGRVLASLPEAPAVLRVLAGDRGEDAADLLSHVTVEPPDPPVDPVELSAQLSQPVVKRSVGVPLGLPTRLRETSAQTLLECIDPAFEPRHALTSPQQVPGAGSGEDLPHGRRIIVTPGRRGCEPGAQLMTIPRVFHRTWLEGPMPDEFVRHGESWLRCNPGWEMVTWTPSSLPPLQNQAAFDAEPKLAGRSDIARYEILLRFGGVYIDCDFECLRNIEPLLDGASLIAGWEDAGAINNAIFGATAGHPVLAELVQAIPGRVASLRDQEINVQHGPVQFTEVVCAHAGSDPGIVLYEPAILYPYHYTESHRCGERFPDAYAVHHWFGSWHAPIPAAPPEAYWSRIAFGLERPRT